MTVKVVDASVVAALLFVEKEADQAASFLADATLIAPQLLAFEIANVAVTKIRRAPLERVSIETGLNRFAGLNIGLMRVDEPAVVELAMRKSLSAYDAAYLWLSMTTGAELVTFDRRLQASSAP